MQLTRNSVELLAPVGTWEALEAAVEAGADAVYLGGKRFNMRMHRTDVNFDDAMLKRAVEYTHKHNVRLYITVNNLISNREIDNMRSYLAFLNEIQPDSLIIQDLAILVLAREMDLTVPLHASVMMNTHNEYAIRVLQKYGITRVVVNRELTLSQLTLLKERTGIELEYFIHGDMCIAHSGQCIYSGVLFGQSSNRGRCLKPCRWPYQLIDEKTGSAINADCSAPFKMAMKDMCMYQNLPELIQAGVCSFKIEGRMRTADFIKKIVGVYRRAIDRYIADPTGYTTDQDDWQDLYESRARDFSTCYALGNPGPSSIGYTGEREPRFFSQAVREPDIKATAAIPDRPTAYSGKQHPTLAVRVSDMPSLTAACQNGADTVYIGGEAFKPYRPWTLDAIAAALDEAAKYHARVVVTTPRVTMERECGELEQLFTSLNKLKPHGLMVSNLGSLRLAEQFSKLPVQTDFSLNVFNHLAAGLLKNHGVTLAAVSPEAAFDQLAMLSDKSPLPLELIAHGPLEAMVMDHCLPAAALQQDHHLCPGFCHNRHFALLDSAGERHLIKTDQYCRNHVLFAKDLCLLQYLGSFSGLITQYRIEGQHYTPEHVGLVTAIYRQELDRLATDQTSLFDTGLLEKIAANSPRKLGIGVFSHRVSR